MTNYKDKDLDIFSPEIAQARVMNADDAAKGHDEGTCVLGAGISVWYIGPRKRKAKRLVLIPAHFQGNVASWKAAQRALTYLKARGLDCHWYDGVMD